MAKPDFDEIIDRTGTACNKWDDMQAIYGVAPGDGIRCGWPTWTSAPASVQRAVEGIWPPMASMAIRRQPRLYRGDPLVDGAPPQLGGRAGMDPDRARAGERHRALRRRLHPAGRCGDPDDPGLSRLARVTRAAGREVREFLLALVDGEYRMDWPAWEKLLTGNEKC